MGHKWVRIKNWDGKQHFRKRHCYDGVIYEIGNWYKVTDEVASKLAEESQLDPPQQRYYDVSYGDLAGTPIPNPDFTAVPVFHVVDDAGKAAIEKDEERLAIKFGKPVAAYKAKAEYDLTKGDGMLKLPPLVEPEPNFTSAPAPAPSKRKK